MAAAKNNGGAAGEKAAPAMAWLWRHRKSANGMAAAAWHHISNACNNNRINSAKSSISDCYQRSGNGMA
jgi:hypothetical protein